METKTAVNQPYEEITKFITDHFGKRMFEVEVVHPAIERIEWWTVFGHSIIIQVWKDRGYDLYSQPSHTNRIADDILCLQDLHEGNEASKKAKEDIKKIKESHEIKPEYPYAKIQYCKRGGQNGFLTTTKLQEKFAKFLGEKFIDGVIPVIAEWPQQKLVLEVCKHIDNDQYWENKDTGSHGWCCANCGKVIQWG